MTKGESMVGSIWHGLQLQPLARQPAGQQVPVSNTLRPINSSDVDNAEMWAGFIPTEKMRRKEPTSSIIKAHSILLTSLFPVPPGTRRA